MREKIIVSTYPCAGRAARGKKRLLAVIEEPPVRIVLCTGMALQPRTLEEAFQLFRPLWKVCLPHNHPRFAGLGHFIIYRPGQWGGLGGLMRGPGAVHHGNWCLIWGLVPVILQSFIQPADQQPLSLAGSGPNTDRRTSAQFHTSPATNNFSKLYPPPTPTPPRVGSQKFTPKYSS